MKAFTLSCPSIKPNFNLFLIYQTTPWSFFRHPFHKLHCIFWQCNFFTCLSHLCVFQKINTTFLFRMARPGAILALTPLQRYHLQVIVSIFISASPAAAFPNSNFVFGLHCLLFFIYYFNKDNFY